MSVPAILIIGGGFSGLMVAANIVRLSTSPLRITLIEPAEELGLGLAYGTCDPSHLLNVRAGRMGAWAGQPDDFWRWLQKEPGARGLNAQSFAPRTVYADYLRAIRHAMFAEAAHKGIALSHVRDSAEAVSEGPGVCKVRLAGGEALTGNCVVIASGNPLPSPSRLMPGAEALDARFLLPSAWDAGELRRRLCDFPTEGDVFILGAGLTMVDSVLTLINHGYRGRIHVLSRNGHLPLPHRDDLGDPLPVPAIMALNQPGALNCLRVLRKTVKQCEARGEDWRQVIDGLRPDTQALWARFPDGERRRFFRRLFGLWNIHRHRMAPQVWERMVELEAKGSLKRLQGRLLHVDEANNRIAVRYRPRGTFSEAVVEADGFMLCAGPGYDFTRGESPLFAQLLRDGLVRPHPSGSGITPSASRVLFIGTPLIGQRLETTAVPELRDQAHEAAEAALHKLKT